MALAEMFIGGLAFAQSAPKPVVRTDHPTNAIRPTVQPVSAYERSGLLFPYPDFPIEVVVGFSPGGTPKYELRTFGSSIPDTETELDELRVNTLIGGVPAVPNGGAPDASEPAHTAPREIGLRQALDAQGYSSVHFKMDGDTLILWGTVPTEADRLMIETQVFFAHFYSIEDHIQVREFAEP
ncbi:MAG: hypothetical protein WCA22_17465 [Candidatus Binatus sp.]